MSYYKLKVKCNDAEVEVIAKSGAVLAREVDRYLQTFLGATPAPVQKTYEQPRQFEAHSEMQDIYVQPQTDMSFNQVAQELSAPQPAEAPFIQPAQTFEQIMPHQAEQPVNTPSFEPAPNFVEQPQVQPQVASEPIVSLGDFVAASKSGQIFDEFIVSAYYLKNLAGQSAFTLKFLNSKFYPATNKLIDFAVIEEGRNRGFIDAIDDEGMTKYCLNTAGEEFFKTHLQ